MFYPRGYFTFQSGLNVSISMRTATEWKQRSQSSSLKLTRHAWPTTVMVSNYAEGVLKCFCDSLRTEGVNGLLSDRFDYQKDLSCQLWWFNWLDYGTEILLLAAPRVLISIFIHWLLWDVSTPGTATLMLFWKGSRSKSSNSGLPQTWPILAIRRRF